MIIHTHTYTHAQGSLLCTLVTAHGQTSPFLTEGSLLVNQYSVAREQLMHCFNRGQSVGMCQCQGGGGGWRQCVSPCVSLCVFVCRRTNEIYVRQVHSIHRYCHTQINTHGNATNSMRALTHTYCISLCLLIIVNFCRYAPFLQDCSTKAH